MCENGDGQFTTVQIHIGNDMDDWKPIWADPDNNICDDADQDAPQAGRDLTHFAYTWDDTSLYTYTARVQANQNDFIYYADTNNDGRMQTGEPVILADWKNNSWIELSIARYAAVDDVDGDLMQGDGHPLPGFVDTSNEASLEDGFSLAGVEMEWRVSWEDLGIAPGTAFKFHVASTNNLIQIPGSIDDNMGGCDGGPASSQFADLTFTPDQILMPSPESTVYAAHELTNTGNGTDTFAFFSNTTGASDYAPEAIAYYRDLGTVGQYDAGTDILLTDTDGDGIVDSGELNADDAINILIAYDAPAEADGIAEVEITAISTYDSIISAMVADEIRSVRPSLTVIKSASDNSAAPGKEITYTVTVLNAGNTEATNVMLTDDMSPYTAWKLDSFSLSGGDSGLTMGEASFSANNGDTFDYSPESGAGDAADGYDGNVTDWRLPLEGNMAAGGSFILQYKLKIR